MAQLASIPPQDNSPGTGILVAVDGSESATAALRWAAREASLRGLGLRVVHVYTWPITGYPGMIPGDLFDALQADSGEILEAAADVVRDVAPEVAMTTESHGGLILPVLLGLAEQSTLAVVGSRGLGGFSGLLLGSVGMGLVARSACPVAVIRGSEPDRTTGPVVVGVDGTSVSEPALAAAFGAAALRKARLVAVHCWQDPLTDVFAGKEDRRPDFGRESWEAFAERTLRDNLAAVSVDFPDVEIEAVVDLRRPSKALLERSAGAQLVVVGGRGRGEFTGLLLGSTSRSMVQHATCPVLVVRPTSPALAERVPAALPKPTA